MGAAGDKIRKDTRITDEKFRTALATAVDALAVESPVMASRLEQAMEYDQKTGKHTITAQRLAESITLYPKLEEPVMAILGDPKKAKELQAKLHQVNGDNKERMDKEDNKGFLDFVMGNFSRPNEAGMVASTTQKAVLDEIATALEAKMKQAITLAAAPAVTVTKPLPTPPKIPATGLQDDHRTK